MTNVIDINEIKLLKEAERALDQFTDVTDSVAYNGQLPSEAKRAFLEKAINMLNLLQSQMGAMKEGLKYERRRD